MRCRRFLVTLALCTGCAVGRLHPDGSVSGLAIGHAKLERAADGTMRIEGGALSNSVSELLSALVAAAGAAYAAYLGGG
jgi:hypothetical protein